MGSKSRAPRQEAVAIEVNGVVVGCVERDKGGRVWAIPDIVGISRVRSQFWTPAQRARLEHLETIDIRSPFRSRRAATLYLERIAKGPLDVDVEGWLAGGGP